MQCRIGVHILNTIFMGFRVCPNNLFTCKNNTAECYARFQMCNGRYACTDRSDEDPSTCPESTTTMRASSQCKFFHHCENNLMKNSVVFLQ